jgi:hypothetical protein
MCVKHSMCVKHNILHYSVLRYDTDVTVGTDQRQQPY